MNWQRFKYFINLSNFNQYFFVSVIRSVPNHLYFTSQDILKKACTNCAKFIRNWCEYRGSIPNQSGLWCIILILSTKLIPNRVLHFYVALIKAEHLQLLDFRELLLYFSKRLVEFLCENDTFAFTYSKTMSQTITSEVEVDQRSQNTDPEVRGKGDIIQINGGTLSG